MEPNKKDLSYLIRSIEKRFPALSAADIEEAFKAAAVAVAPSKDRALLRREVIRLLKSDAR
jgi:hypothetical protein